MKFSRSLGNSLAIAAIGFLFSTHTMTPTAKTVHSMPVKCLGVNGCRGESQCRTAANACNGKNGCQYQGWIYTDSTEDCITRGGKAENIRTQVPPCTTCNK